VRVSLRIFLGYVFILALGFYFLITWIMTDVNIQPKKAMEESMVDVAQILAAFLEENTFDRRIVVAPLRAFLERAREREFKAQIYEMNKERMTLDVYVTDENGTVIFDSDNGRRVGRDFSQMRDVNRALKGVYGARTSRSDPDDPLTGVAYVAAPVRFEGEIIGVCTVAKAWNSINTFIDSTRRRIILAGLLGFAIVLVLSFFISRWITRPIRRLTDYVGAVKEGEQGDLPKLRETELKELGISFQQLRVSLEGKKYIERYVQTLTHQLKGPLSAIRGAAELLQEDLPEPDRKRFISNIDSESNRLQRIVERMLELASLEQRRELRNVESIDLGQMVKEIIDDMAVPLKRKEIILLLKFEEGLCAKGERFLIYQAVLNLLHNAVDFSPKGGSIEVEIKEHWNRLFLILRDSGPGIPEYARDKIFDKFYSLQRPDSGKKSSGLGLSLVKEVAELHKGSINLKNNKPPQTGVVAILRLPRA